MIYGVSSRLFRYSEGVTFNMRSTYLQKYETDEKFIFSAISFRVSFLSDNNRVISAMVNLSIQKLAEKPLTFLLTSVRYLGVMH